jgi:hypothetical protein
MRHPTEVHRQPEKASVSSTATVVGCDGCMEDRNAQKSKQARELRENLSFTSDAETTEVMECIKLKIHSTSEVGTEVVAQKATCTSPWAIN